MPGFAGYAPHRVDLPAASAVERMADSIAHGPFSRVVARLEDGVFATHVHTGSPAYPVERAQPARDRCTIWVDGTIHGIASGERFLPPAGGSSAAFADLYREDPELGFLGRLNGVFTAMVHDPERRRLHLITDRYGLRQLYWHATPDGVAWASELKALLHTPGFSPDIDPLAVRQFFEVGYLLENTTWFEGVELVPSGSVLTIDLTTRSTSLRRYWWWSDIPQRSAGDIDDITEELGRLFRDAVALRAEGSSCMAVMLSGGLDSRAVLAALPAGTPHVATFTFGGRECADEVIARRVSAIAGVPHHFLEINSDNWLDGRFNAVWRTDGALDLMHMHGSRADAFISRHCRVNMSGFAGDLILGGSYLPDPRRSAPDGLVYAAELMDCDPGLLDYTAYRELASTDFYFLQNRVRRFTAAGTLVGRPFLEYFKPFHDNALIDFVYSLPDGLRAHSHLYNRMLLTSFPEFYRGIPWQRTGLPIDASKTTLRAAHLFRAVMRNAQRLLAAARPGSGRSHGMVDYARLLRETAAVRLFEELVLSRSSRSAEYRDPATVRAAWSDHHAGRSREQDLFRALTFEVWLRQVFDGTHRGELP